MHRFFAHPKTRPSAACNLRCCGNRFANRIPRSGHRKGHTAQRMRRYVRHVEHQAVADEIAEGVFEAYLDGLDAKVRHILHHADHYLEQLEVAGDLWAAMELRLFARYAGVRVHDEIIMDVEQP